MRTQHGVTWRTGLAWAAIAALSCAVATLDPAASPLAAAPTPEYFKGKTIRVIVGYAPGGGYDLYARLLTDNLARFLPGVVPLIQYMPGAATEVAARYIMEVAPQDGTVIGIPVASLPIASYVQHNPGEGIDVAALQWIGRMDSIDAVAAVWHTAGVDSMETALRRQLVFGATSPSGSSFMVPQALVRLKILNLKIVMGYKGTSDAYLAMERGEIDGMANAIWSQIKRGKPDWVEDRKIRIIYQQSEKRAADLADVPALVELARNETESRVFRLLASESTIGRSFYIGPKVPPERVAALRQAFAAMVADPAFRASADRLETPIDPLSGEEMQQMITAISRYPPEVFQTARELTAP